jgi:O-methyltransferase involved in polyketide biosynthesis
MSDATSAFDTTAPNIARIYDVLLGGKENFQADRDAAAELLQRFPPMALMCRAQRECLIRMVRFLVGECGIGQFLDIGSGLPTQQNVHQVALDANPAARVVYADKDPVVLLHAEALLSKAGQVHVMSGDLLQPEKLLADAAEQGIDFGQPVAVLILGLLHFVPDAADPHSAVATIRDALPPGSYLALSHGEDSADAAEIAAAYRDAGISGSPRVRADILRFFGDFELQPPGLAPVAEWRLKPGHVDPNADALRPTVGGVARRNKS